MRLDLTVRERDPTDSDESDERRRARARAVGKDGRRHDRGVHRRDREERRCGDEREAVHGVWVLVCCKTSDGSWGKNGVEPRKSWTLLEKELLGEGG